MKSRELGIANFKTQVTKAKGDIVVITKHHRIASQEAAYLAQYYKAMKDL